MSHKITNRCSICGLPLVSTTTHANAEACVRYFAPRYAAMQRRNAQLLRKLNDAERRIERLTLRVKSKRSTGDHARKEALTQIAQNTTLRNQLETLRIENKRLRSIRTKIEKAVAA